MPNLTFFVSLDVHLSL